MDWKHKWVMMLNAVSYVCKLIDGSCDRLGAGYGELNAMVIQGKVSAGIMLCFPLQ